jgi:Holliday junction resolvase RusA-like endonuclease
VPRKRNAEPPRERGPWPLGTQLAFFVGGVAPTPKGNMRAFVPKAWAIAAHAAGQAPRAVVTDGGGSTLRAYESAVRNAARVEVDRRRLPCALRQPFEAIVGFYFARPDADFDPHGHLVPGARLTPWVDPDIDKLVRPALDAITGIVFDNDSRVVRLVVEKQYSTANIDVGTWLQLKRLPATVRELARSQQTQLPQRRPV